jgi:hypothetical protein
MPAMIIVESGALAGKSFAIEKESVRIGSGDRCEIRLNDPNLTDHVFTVEYLNGTYQIFNRAAEAITVEGQKLESRKLTKWNSGKTVQLSGGMVLRLKVESDPRPIAKSGDDNVKVDEIKGDESADAKAKEKAKSKNTMQMMIILTCFGLTAILLAMVAMDPEPEVVDVQDKFQIDFEKLYEELKANPPKLLEFADLADRFQIARTYELSNQRAKALGRYRELQLQFLPRLENNGAKVRGDDDKGTLQKTYIFVSYAVIRLGNTKAN